MSELAIEEAATEDVKSMIKSGICPMCSKGPFKVVAQHVRIWHQLNTREFRDRYGFLYNESICDPALSAQMRNRKQNKLPVRLMGKPITVTRSKEQARINREILQRYPPNKEQLRSRQLLGAATKRNAPLVHGTSRAYNNHHCRCAECREYERLRTRTRRIAGATYLIEDELTG